MGQSWKGKTLHETNAFLNLTLGGCIEEWYSNLWILGWDLIEVGHVNPPAWCCHRLLMPPSCNTRGHISLPTATRKHRKISKLCSGKKSHLRSYYWYYWYHNILYICIKSGLLWFTMSFLYETNGIFQPSASQQSPAASDPSLPSHCLGEASTTRPLIAACPEPSKGGTWHDSALSGPFFLWKNKGWPSSIVFSGE